MSVKVVVLSTADLDSAVWTNKQHIASRLANNYEVMYVGSVALRRPRIQVSDIRRILGLFGSERPSRNANLPSQLRHFRPILIPLHGVRCVDLINRILVQLYLKQRRVSLGESVLYTFSPITFGLEEKARATIYHSVDLLHEITGVPHGAMIKAERSLLLRAEAVIASSTGVKEHLARLAPARSVHLWENVADIKLFRYRGTTRQQRAIFSGHLTLAKVDIDWLHALVYAGIDLAIAGPISIDGVRDDGSVKALLEHERVEYLGNLPLESLAHEVKNSIIGVVPYKRNNYTTGVFPMKIYEYLSAGLVVLSSPLTSLDKPIQGLRIVASARDLVEAARYELQAFSSEGARQRSEAAEPHSWESRVAELSSLIDSISDGACG